MAGLLSAGVLFTGALLALLEIAAPALIPGSGLTATEGPRWDRVLVPLVAGLVGELVRWLRHRFVIPARGWVAVAVMMLCLFALWWGWWR